MAGRTMNDKLRAAIAGLALTLLAACSPGGGTSGPAAPPLAGARIGGPFSLTDQDGQRVTDRSFIGKYRIMYFGYTYCPDVCPVDVQNIALAMRSLDKTDPALSARIVPIFVTVDPARDTPEVLKQFTSAFYPRFVGLTGTPAEIAKVKEAFAIFSQAQPPQPGGGYTVNHSRLAYLFDPDGKPLALLPQDRGAPEIVSDIKRWTS